MREEEVSVPAEVWSGASHTITESSLLSSRVSEGTIWGLPGWEMFWLPSLLEAWVASYSLDWTNWGCFLSWKQGPAWMKFSITKGRSFCIKCQSHTYTPPPPDKGCRYQKARVRSFVCSIPDPSPQQSTYPSLWGLSLTDGCMAVLLATKKSGWSALCLSRQTNSVHCFPWRFGLPQMQFVCSLHSSSQ